MDIEELDDRALADTMTEALRRQRHLTLDRFVSTTCNEVERTVFVVWDSCALICSGGFLYLLENDADLAECAQCYQRIGLDEIAALFLEVLSLIPIQFRDRPHEDFGDDFSDWAEDDKVYEQFRSLDRRYFELSEGDAVCAPLAQYIRKHKESLSP